MSTKNNEGLVAILSYFVIGIIWYFIDKEAQTPFTTHHVKQALNLFILSIATNVVLTVLIITILLIPLVQIAYIILWVFGIVKAAQGLREEIPLIGQFAERYLRF